MTLDKSRAWDLARLIYEPMQQSDLDEVVAVERSVYPHPWTRTNFSDSLKNGYHAWVLRDPRVTSALIGARTVEHLHNSRDAVKNLTFSAEELAEIMPFELPHPHPIDIVEAVAPGLDIEQQRDQQQRKEQHAVMRRRRRERHRQQGGRDRDGPVAGLVQPVAPARHPRHFGTVVVHHGVGGFCRIARQCGTGGREDRLFHAA